MAGAKIGATLGGITGAAVGIKHFGLGGLGIAAGSALQSAAGIGALGALGNMAFGKRSIRQEGTVTLKKKKR